MDELFAFFESMFSGAQPKQIAYLLAKDNGGIGISTVLSPDRGYETAIVSLRKIYIVERYPNEQAAVTGHAQWIDRTRNSESLIIRPITWCGNKQEIVLLVKE